MSLLYETPSNLLQSSYLTVCVVNILTLIKIIQCYTFDVCFFLCLFVFFLIGNAGIVDLMSS